MHPGTPPRTSNSTGQALLSLIRRDGSVDCPPEALGKALLAAAERHAVLGLLLVSLDRRGQLGELTARSGLDAVDHLRRLRRQAARWDLERDAVLARLSKAGIPAVLLKGAVLRLTVYREPAERALSDLDLLVPREALQPALEILEAAGYESGPPDQVARYREYHHHLILRNAGGFVVELHWALVPPDSVWALDPAAFLGNARTIATPGGYRVRIPSAEHLVLHLAQQNVEEGFTQLRWIVDVDRVIATQQLDWEQLAEEAIRMRLQGATALTMGLARALFGTSVPECYLETLRLSRASRTHLALLDPVRVVLEQRGLRGVVHDSLLLWCLPDRRARLSVLKQMLTGAWDRDWRRVAEWKDPSIQRRLASLLKLTAYQAWLYHRLVWRPRALVSTLVQF
jgi:hypothetical protein